MEMQTAPNTLSGFAQHLVAQNLLSEQTAQELIVKASATNTTLISFLCKEKIIEPAQLTNTIAKYFGLAIFELDALNHTAVPSEFLQNPIVQQRQALPFYANDDNIFVAIADPTIRNLDNISFLTGLHTTFVVVHADKLEKTIDACSENALGAMLNDITDAQLDSASVSNSQDNEKRDNEKIDAEDAPVVRYINKILLDAVKKGASDIHFEPYESYYRIRLRLDGILVETASPPTTMANYLTARLKVLANIDISERRIPQDGRFKLKISDKRSIDFRVNTCPTLYGEKVVLRILESSTELLDLNVLGMSEQQQTLFQREIKRSQGMILVTGPTGSGKTVSLYTGLKILNTADRNISTVEDPIEIQLPGINQVQVNTKTGMTFASALRAFLRQDPDIIMVGEIRDLETAEIAVKASQTGHLVLSTLHTNSAAETLVRLSNMGIPTYNIASSVSLIIAQRLLRKLCEHCKKPVDLPKQTLLEEGFQQDALEGLNIYGPQGCEHCNNGYKGRLGIYEVVPISSEMERLILQSCNAPDLSAQARKEGYPSLRDSGLEKVQLGLTSLDEVNRII